MVRSPSLCLATVAVFVVQLQNCLGAVPGMVNPGSPSGIQAAYDCEVRRHAYTFGKVRSARLGWVRILMGKSRCTTHCPTLIVDKVS